MQYRSIDLLKFLLSLMVVGIHARAISDGNMPFLLETVASLAVPFFFITSGFLLCKKTFADSGVLKSDGLVALTAFLRKATRLYVLWTLIYLPFTLAAFYIGGRPWYVDLAVFIRGFLFIGEHAFSWPLWYLLAAIVGVFLIWAGLRFRMRLAVVFLVSLVLMGVGWWFQSLLNAYADGELQNVWVGAYRSVFGSTRNGVFRGMAYVAAGMMVWRYGWSRKEYRLVHIFFILSGGGTKVR